MNIERKERLNEIYQKISRHFFQGVIPYWLERGIDREFGGYLTTFDAQGKWVPGDQHKYIVTQTRMIWGTSLFYERLPQDSRSLQAASQGVDFFVDHFWDTKRGGWFWKVQRDGSLVDAGKVVYGQSFAIYALAKYTLSTGDKRGLDYADRTFDLLQRYCSDTARGGYYENLEPDWRLSEPGFAAGDRKSLDIHMHLLECFTTLYEASGMEIHRRRLQEIIEVILKYMIHPEFGCGLNQFDHEFRPVPPIAIRRTWNAEREGDLAGGSLDTTSYVHNLELVWLLVYACGIMELSVDPYRAVIQRLVDHTLQYGIDWTHGGIYRDGPHNAPAVIRDKEWWQHTESLVGLLDAYLLFGNESYLDAFEKVWWFSDQFFINHELGEWRTLLTETGEPIDAGLGNPWKACYHTGRAMDECMKRLKMILKE